jgi:hypothetical protein
LLKNPSDSDACQTTPTLGARLFQSVSYAWVPFVYWTSSGDSPAIVPGLKRFPSPVTPYSMR